jgi:hypothetical protein
MPDIIRRGQASGGFDASVPARWLLSASLALGRAAEDEVKAGRTTIEQGTQAVRQAFLRLPGAAPGPGTGAGPDHNQAAGGVPP